MNSTAPIEAPAGGRLATLLTLLQSDPANVLLLADAAEAAVAERAPDAARALLERHAALAPLSPPQLNLAGLAALQSRDFEAAAARFGDLVDQGVGDPSVRFNLAWSLAMLKDFPGAAGLLDDVVVEALPQAAMLRVQLLHEQALFDEAAAEAAALLAIHPGHQGLLAAVSVLALDIDDEALALSCATKAGGHPDALATLGILALGDERAGEALEMFDRVLADHADKPRAWIGRGLSKLRLDDTPGAIADIDRGAEMFGDHLGSWLAAGWAHFINRDWSTSRARFETALALDATFAETHGSLAVLDLLEGDADGAKRHCETALRLDRQCYTAALAKALLAEQAGDGERARSIFDRALNTPVDASGRTIAQSLGKLSL